MHFTNISQKRTFQPRHLLLAKWDQARKPRIRIAAPKSKNRSCLYLCGECIIQGHKIRILDQMFSNVTTLFSSFCSIKTSWHLVLKSALALALCWEISWMLGRFRIGICKFWMFPPSPPTHKTTPCNFLVLECSWCPRYSSWQILHNQCV